MTKTIQIFGRSGDPARCPPFTQESCWAALGGGSDGLSLGVSLSSDGHLVCAPAEILNTDGVEVSVSKLQMAEIAAIDAGAHWTPPNLSSNPWAGHGSNKATRYLHFEQALQIFGRRTQLLVCPEPSQQPKMVIKAIIDCVCQFGLQSRITLVLDEAEAIRLRELHYEGNIAIAVSGPIERISSNLVAQFSHLRSTALVVAAQDYRKIRERIETLSKDTWAWIVKTKISTTDIDLRDVSGILTEDVLLTKDYARPASMVFEDNFDGTEIDRDQWAAGYSHVNTDSEIFQDDGIHIEIKEGGSYSGAAIVTAIPIHGDFDATVEYKVASPHQGTTFEMAAIGIDPGYFNIDNQRLTGRKVNLTFDVHGAPPYASSECDEDDGHRLGWNNGFNLTKVGDVSVVDSEVKIDAWSASSINMYNKYRRDIGTGASAGSKGKLRLRRHGQVFTAYYQDAETTEWVCSGTALVQNLGQDVFIRLAAKHWKKKNPQPPGNKVSFNNFSLAQF